MREQAERTLIALMERMASTGSTAEHVEQLAQGVSAISGVLAQVYYEERTERYDREVKEHNGN